MTIKKNGFQMTFLNGRQRTRWRCAQNDFPKGVSFPHRRSVCVEQLMRVVRKRQSELRQQPLSHGDGLRSISPSAQLDQLTSVLALHARRTEHAAQAISTRIGLHE